MRAEELSSDDAHRRVQLRAGDAGPVEVDVGLVGVVDLAVPDQPDKRPTPAPASVTVARRRSSRRHAHVVTLTAVAALIAGALGERLLQDRREAAAARSTVDLMVDPVDLCTRPQGGISLILTMTNLGPLPVMVDGVDAVGPGLHVREPPRLRIRPGVTAQARMSLDVDCAGRIPNQDPPVELTLDVRAADGSVKDVAARPVPARLGTGLRDSACSLTGD